MKSTHRRSRQLEQHRAFFNRARALEQQRTQAEAIVVVTQHAEIRPAQQLHRGATQAFVQCLPMSAALCPLPQQGPQWLARPLTGQGLQASRRERVQLQAFEGIGQALYQRARGLLQQHSLVMLEVHQQDGVTRVTQQCLPLAQGQPLAQQAGDGVCTIGKTDRCGCVHGQGLHCQLHPAQGAADGTVIKYVLRAIAVAQLAPQILDPALQSRALLTHAQGRVAQRRRIADDQQVAIVQILAAADLAVRQRRCYA